VSSRTDTRNQKVVLREILQVETGRTPEVQFLTTIIDGVNVFKDEGILIPKRSSKRRQWKKEIFETKHKMKLFNEASNFREIVVTTKTHRMPSLKKKNYPLDFSRHFSHTVQSSS